VLGAGSLLAQGTLDTTITVRGTPRLVVANQNGEVVVRAWGRNQIRIEAESERARIEVDESAGRVSVRSVSRRGNPEVSYSISVPGGTAIEVSGISTDVTLSDVCGEVNINNVSGDITVVCSERLASIQSVSGDIELRDIRGDLDVSATSGDVTVRGVRGSVSAHAVSGDMELSDIEGSDVTAESVSGDVDYDGVIRDNGRYRFQSHSGDVTVRMQGAVNATFTVSTYSGEFEPNFEVRLEPGTRLSREWQFRLGTGSARVRLESFSGSIQLQRGAGSPREE
jgi:DUF4097 and DUF4098 domain-containing protein YvlB